MEDHHVLKMRNATILSLPQHLLQLLHLDMSKPQQQKHKAADAHERRLEILNNELLLQA